MADARLKEVRRGLKQRLRLQGTDLRQAIWRDLVDSHIVDLLSRGEIDFEYLAALYLLRERKAAARRARPVVVREVAGEAAREQVLATMLARRLSRASGVIAFREEVLAGQLLSRMQLPRWIEAQARRDAAIDARSTAASPPRRPLDWLFAQGDPDFAPAPRGQEQLSAEETRGNPPAPAIPLSATLGYCTPEGAVALTSVCAGGRLDRLKRIVSGNDGVCALSGWSEPAAVSFVLCGHIPTHARARAFVRPGAYRALDRIELSLAAELSPKEVAALYRDVRPRQRAGHSRRLGKKQLALALFADEARGEDRSWKALRRRWNRRHPDWRFKPGGDPHARHFARAAKRAWSCVTGERWRRH
jgi:hypothetical protein